MDLKIIKEILKKGGLSIKEEKRLKDNNGNQLRLNNGGKINVYDTGKVVCGGKNKEVIEKLLSTENLEIDIGGLRSNKVFVVYGHDEVANSQLDAMLRRWGIEPLFLDQLPSEGQTLIEKLEKYTDKNLVNYAIVLATPDDEGYKKGHEDKKAYRARQNVVLELGMVLAKLGRSKVAILLKESEGMERPSDIQGLIYITFKDDLQKNVAVPLSKEMAKNGFNIDVCDL